MGEVTPEGRSPLCERLLSVALSAPTSALCETVGGGSIQLSQLLREAELLARDLTSRGLAGERVLIMLDPGIEWARAFLATLLAGAVAVPLPLSAPAVELAYLASDSRPRASFASDSYRERLPRGLEVLATTPRGGDSAVCTLPAATCPALILYTSGTTGRPKGALITHQNLFSQTSALCEAWGLSRSDVLLHALPLHHLHGVVVAFLSALTAGASIRMLAKFDADVVLRELDAATVFMAVPTMIQRILDRADALASDEQARCSAAAGALRLVTSGSAALPLRLSERWRKLAGAIPLERYGMTEIGIALSNSLDVRGRKPGFVGSPLATVEIRIVGDDGVDGDGPGELLVGGPSVFAGYFDRPDATRESFRDGWFITGDVAIRDAAGNVRLLGRKSADILKTGGEKVSALEIEEVLREYEPFAEVAVVGVPDAEWGDRVVACVVARAGAEAAAATAPMRAWAKQQLAPYKVPREVLLLPELPKNAMGKVQKGVLVAMLGKRDAASD